MVKVIAIGEVLVEMMAKETGQGFRSPGTFFGPFPSGAPAIFIDQVARMGVRCGLIARIGNDDFGQMCLERLRRDGVDTAYVLKTGGYTTGTAFVSYDSDGERRFIFHFAHSAAGRLNPDDVREEYVKEAEYLHVMGCSLAAGATMREAIVKAVKTAKKYGVKISFDPNIRPELASQEECAETLRWMLQQTDVLLAGEREAAAIAHAPSPGEAAETLRNMGIPAVVIKRGARGVQVYSPEGVRTFPPIPVEQIDPTGAGDCFDGAFVACLVEGMDYFRAAEIANAAGALGVTRLGPMEGAFPKEEIMHFFDKNVRDRSFS